MGLSCLHAGFLEVHQVVAHEFNGADAEGSCEPDELEDVEQALAPLDLPVDRRVEPEPSPHLSLG